MKLKATFSEVIEHLQNGGKAQRENWNGKGMFIFIVAGEAVQTAIWECYGDTDKPEEVLPVEDSIYLKTADDKLVPWLASQVDLLSDDWTLM